MLILSRKRNERIIVGGGLVTITVIDLQRGKVRLGIEAEKDISVHREEVWRQIVKQNEETARKGRLLS